MYDVYGLDFSLSVSLHWRCMVELLWGQQKSQVAAKVPTDIKLAEFRLLIGFLIDSRSSILNLYLELILYRRVQTFDYGTWWTAVRVYMRDYWLKEKVRKNSTKARLSLDFFLTISKERFKSRWMPAALGHFFAIRRAYAYKYQSRRGSERHDLWRIAE